VTNAKPVKELREYWVVTNQRLNQYQATTAHVLEDLRG